MKAGFILIASVCFIAAMARPQQREKGAVAAPKASSTPAASAHEQIEIVAPSVTRPRPDYQFPLGETYVYGAEWRIFNAGIATLRMEKAGQENRIVASADAAGTVALLYHVQDRLESFFDPTNFCSRNTSRHVEEGFRRVDTNITFDYAHRK